jgi:LPXTG-motif cell wall-anchored protein
MAGSVMMASPASAHVPDWTLDCDSVTVNLRAYAAHGNHVTVSADGKQLVDTDFGRDFQQEVDLPAHTSPLEVHLVVKASDDSKYNVDDTKTSPVCEGQEQPTPTPSVTPSEKPTPSASAVPSPSQSSSAPAAKPVDHESPAPSKDLAETGASSTTPLIAGIAAAVVVVGAGLVVLARKRRSSQA